jgi:GxxExxY protein
VPGLDMPEEKEFRVFKNNSHGGIVMSKLIHYQLSHKVLGIAFKVHNLIGPGLHESAYEEALCIELTNAGIRYNRQRVFPIYYSGQYISTYVADIVVDNTIILELKSVRELNHVMFAQIINYLKLSGLQVGYILNFHNIKVEWKRFVNTKC